MDTRLIRDILEKNYEIVLEKRYKNCAYRLKEKNGSIVFCYDKGSFSCQGKRKKELEALLNREISEKLYNNKVFLVYGHDVVSRQQTENLLRQWNLEPLTIDNLPTNGRIIVEQLEKYIPQANFGIVLITPDDIGYSTENERSKKYRARQNVVLEMGMLLSKLGRSKIAVVIKKDSDKEIEKPSDIQRILYHSFNESIDEIAHKLARE